MRLIDADALKDRLDYCVKEGMGSTIAFTFKHMVDDAPTIEPKRGEWKLFYESKDGDNVYKCSCCRLITVIPEGIKLFSFCPNCGCAMTKE